MSHGDSNDCPFVSVIVPVWNSPALIRTCLQALLAQSYPADRREILVVDNGSTDGTRDAVREFPEVTLLEEPQPGSYCARNRGLAVAKGEYIAFTDADCIPDKDWLTNAVRSATAHPAAGVQAGRIELFLAEPIGNDPLGSEACKWFERLFAFRQDLTARKGLCATANWLSPRELLLKTGGFQADRKSGADGEMAQRLHNAGHSVVYVPDMLVHHPVRGTFSELAQKRRRLMGGRWERTQGPGRLPYILLVIAWDTLRRLKTTALYPGPSFRIRLRVAYLVIALAGVATAELFRLAGAQTAQRA
jgi:glycosyltransferase involved in cell wall biosynthesis